MLSVALEVRIVDSVETDERGKEAPVCLGNSVSADVAPCG